MGVIDTDFTEEFSIKTSVDLFLRTVFWGTYQCFRDLRVKDLNVSFLFCW